MWHTQEVDNITREGEKERIMEKRTRRKSADSNTGTAVSAMPKYITPRNIADDLNISYAYAVKLLRTGVIPEGLQIGSGGTWRVPSAAYEQWKQEQQVKAKQQAESLRSK